MHNQVADEKMIRISKLNPTEIYTFGNGRLIVNGTFFDTEHLLKKHVKATAKIGEFKNFFRPKR